MAGSQEIMPLLLDWSQGDPYALDRLVPPSYTRNCAGWPTLPMRRERPGHTLQTSALLNEAGLRPVGQRTTRWPNASPWGRPADRTRR